MILFVHVFRTFAGELFSVTLTLWNNSQELEGIWIKKRLNTEYLSNLPCALLTKHPFLIQFKCELVVNTGVTHFLKGHELLLGILSPATVVGYGLLSVWPEVKLLINQISFKCFNLLQALLE